MQPPLSAPFHLRRAALLLAGMCAVAVAGSAQPASAPQKGEPAYDNYIDVSAGATALQDGDPAYFQKRNNLRKEGYGGIEDLYYNTNLGGNTALTVKGRALAGNNDYLIDLHLTKDEVGYLSAGYREYRTWFDDSAAFFPPNGFFPQSDIRGPAVDRGNLWLEAGLTLPDRPNIVLRYDMLTRDGAKDSTSWADSNLTGGLGTRGILPAFLRFDEKRHVVQATVSRDAEPTSWEIAARYENGEVNNSRNFRRRTGESVERAVTSKEGQDSELYHVRGTVGHRLNERFLLTAAAAHTKLDATISGSRIYGLDYEAVFDPLFARRQQRDEGFYALHGSTEMKQSVATLNLLYTPAADWSIVPSLHAEKIKWDNIAEVVETNVGSGPSFTASEEEVETESTKEWKNVTGSIEARYNGLKQTTVSARAEWTQSDGDLDEQFIEAEDGTVDIDRLTDFSRDVQKYSFTTNCYPRPDLSFGLQYYLKLRQNDYDVVRDSTPNTLEAGDRYPAFIADQDFETNDFNVRVSWRACPQLRTVTRYDYQKSTIRTQDVGLDFIESADLESSIITESISWNPFTRWFVQANASYVKDSLDTPATTLTGAAGGRVQVSDNDYLNLGFNTGYALDDRTDIYADYSYYRADNFIDNSANSLGYGSGATEHLASLTLVRRLNPQTVVTLKYAYADSDDATSGGFNSYTAHLFYGKVQYRF